jgi:hypothetical protein
MLEILVAAMVAGTSVPCWLKLTLNGKMTSNESSHPGRTSQLVSGRLCSF